MKMKEVDLMLREFVQRGTVEERGAGGEAGPRRQMALRKAAQLAAAEARLIEEAEAEARLRRATDDR
jgi:hypothetical protein